jgi:glyoxylase-like metal-dependent hydrolase (beta-lactamase superfamily II)
MKPGVFAWLSDDVVEQVGDPQFSRAGNAGFVVGNDAVVVINTTNNPFRARELLYEIRQHAEQPVRYVINTDSDGEKILGNEVFFDLQAAILSTPSVQAEIYRYRIDVTARTAGDFRMPSRMRGIHVTLPTQTLVQGMDLPVQGQQVRVISIPTGPSISEAAVLLPQARIAFVGDLVENAYYPRLGSADLKTWVKSLREIESWNVDTFVPGHGAPGGRDAVMRFRIFLEWLTREVETRVRAGKSPYEIREELLPVLQNYHWHAPELATPLIGSAYNQLSSEAPAAPQSGVVPDKR